ncbi:6-pyruvoyl trahydropterin synthase family protein [Legionella saoudiensis]|uniref:6-pyruvoyl trahydropterin synthase family protein n=1 Tax=Legionella saoudiensis TaxID=1750561 RepID=UPI000731758A|nr:6-carboxytetrahydropterin synthase [Legionella saoudiensis]
MHSLIFQKKFIAQHFLFGKDFGPENKVHSHHYTFELEIENALLDSYNFLIDIVDVQSHIDHIIHLFQDKILNEIPEFLNQNPSLEFFSKVLWKKFKEHLPCPENSLLTIRLWEDNIAQATYREVP